MVRVNGSKDELSKSGEFDNKEDHTEFDTAPPTLPAADYTYGFGSGSQRLPKKFGSPWRWVQLAVVLTIVAVAVSFMFWRRPYYALSPGSVRDTSQRVEVSDTEVFIPDGQIGFVTVSLTERVSMWEYIGAKIDDSVDLVHEDIINGDRTADEKREEDRRRMQDSKDNAAVVALEYLGYEIPRIGLGVEVAGITECMPAVGLLNTGDLIVGLDGKDVGLREELVAGLAGAVPGQEITLDVDRIEDGSVEEIVLELGSSADPCLEERDDFENERPRIGIELGREDLVDYDLPVDVSIDTDRVGGPSAGLAFALSIIDVLTPGELTGGGEVATTGTITTGGFVGRVGGVKQKTVAARDSGVDLFLVPSDELEEALQFAGDMDVRAVDTLDDAMEALDELGGNSLEISRDGEPSEAAAGS